ncbi:MAG: hypothetical protein JW734_00675 [Candidatus Omnitrophica bacterium]|nr:hypothetical protein [Candidatus Omnitrophota bacterium]
MKKAIFLSLGLIFILQTKAVSYDLRQSSGPSRIPALAATMFLPAAAQMQPLKIFIDGSVNDKLMNSIAITGSGATTEHGDNVYKLMYDKNDGIEACIILDFKSTQDISGWPILKIEVEGIDGQGRIQEFGITLRAKDRSSNKMPLHLDVSENGAAALDLSKIEDVNLTQIESISIHFGQKYSYLRMTPDFISLEDLFKNNPDQGQILIKSIYLDK